MREIVLLHLASRLSPKLSTKLRRSATVAYSILLACYAVARVFQIVPGRLPLGAVVALHVLPLLLFGLIHGAISYRLSGIFWFLMICLIVGNICENLGVVTGFPFGRYYFTDAMGPKLFHVPILLGLAYVGMGYLSWTLGRLITGDFRLPLSGARTVTVPLVASFIMVAWDLANDPVWANINRLWVWQEGGRYFGVPLTNFLGWYLVIYAIYQLFAIYLRGRVLSNDPLPPSYWLWAIVFYAVSAAGNVIIVLPKTNPIAVFDATGEVWSVKLITATCALVSIFVMGAFVVIAWMRLVDKSPEGAPALFQTVAPNQALQPTAGRSDV